MPAIIKGRRRDQNTHRFALLKEKKIMKRRVREHRPLWMCQQTTNALKMDKWTVSKAVSCRDTGFTSEARSLSQRPHMNFHDCVISVHTSLDPPAYVATLLFSDRQGRCYSSPYSEGGKKNYTANTVLICIFRIIHKPQTLRSCDLYLHKESGPGKRSPCPGCVGVPECRLLELQTRILRQPMYFLYSSTKCVNFKTVMLSPSISFSVPTSFFSSLF